MSIIILQISTNALRWRITVTTEKMLPFLSVISWSNQEIIYDYHAEIQRSVKNEVKFISNCFEVIVSYFWSIEEAGK